MKSVCFMGSAKTELSAFQKKSRKTSGFDLKLARRRYREAKAIESEG